MAALFVFALLASVGTPAFAATRSMNSTMRGMDPVPPTFDVLVMRPVGLLTVAGGFCLFVATSPITLITRPHEIGIPWNRLVVRPAKFVWADPIGQH